MIQIDKLRDAGVPEQDIRQLEAAWEVFQNTKNHAPHQTPHIVCTGIYNAGKSTLLNALAGKELFQTGDVPTTKVLAQEEFGGAVYVDTPGLNAAEEDDQETQTAYETADFILFVANAQDGGVSEAEAAWLQKLKARYSGLQQRLIFVLTHCMQVEREQLPAIREKVSEDLKKALGFAPEQVFCVDSVTYQNGVEAKKSLLVENSGISHLKNDLMELIARSEKTLKEAHRTEQAEILTILKKMKSQCQKRIAECSTQSQMDDIERLLKETECKIKEECKCSIYIGDTYLYHSPETTRFKRMGVTSPFSVEKDAKDGLNRYAGECVSEAKEKLDKCMQEIKKYYTAGIDSPYFKACSAVNGLLEKLLFTLQRKGIEPSQMKDIQVEPNPRDLARLPSKISEVRSRVEFYEGNGLFDTYYDVFGGRFKKHDIRDYVCKKTLFGEKYVEDVGTEIDADSAMEAALKQVRTQLERFEDSAKGAVGSVLEPYLKKLQSEATECLSKFRREADASLSAARQEMVKPYQNVQSILSDMENEVKQWEI